MRRAACLRLLLLLLASCAPPDFAAPSQLRSVRVLATRADPPYAPPDSDVNLQILAVDAREQPREPLHVYFLPEPCINPAGDAYYNCFAQFRKRFQRGVDLGPELRESTSFAFHMPEDVIATHGTAPGEAYGLAVVFSIACAGHVEYRPDLAGAAVDAVPFACFDAEQQRLGADDFVFAFSLVYAFAARSNANPTFEAATYAGRAIDANAGLDLVHCDRPSLDDCPASKLDLIVPASSQEFDPSNLSADGTVLKETLYVRYFATGGKISSDTLVLLDPRAGRLAHTGDEFRAPQRAGEYSLWAVLHDNRGGVSWQQFPLHVH